MEFYGSNLHSGFNGSWAPKQILDKARISKFSIHPDSSKTNQNPKSNFRWIKRKRDITKCISNTIHVNRVKASHLQVAGIFQPCVHHHRNRKTWIWISLLGCQASLKGMIPYGPLSNKLINMTHSLPVYTTYTTETCTENYLGHMFVYISY
jgi:hypothetical protein